VQAGSSPPSPGQNGDVFREVSGVSSLPSFPLWTREEVMQNLFHPVSWFPLGRTRGANFHLSSRKLSYCPFSFFFAQK